MAGSSTTSVADRQTSVAAQTSAYGGPVPVVFGTTRVASNLIWLGNFQSKAATTTSGGKGGSSSNTTYTYTGAAILSICEGQITGIGTVWKDANITTLSALGLSFFSGAATQATWSFLTGWSNSTNWVRDVAYGYAGSSPAFTSQALNYSSLAYVAASSFDLGSGANVPNIEFEVQGFNIIGGGNPDANPANVVTQIITNVQYGGYFNTGSLDALSSWSTYCQALGLFVSPAYTQQRATTDCIMELCDATNAAPVWSNGVLKIIPYGDKAITGNGVTYTPNTTPLYDLADDDFQGNLAEPVLVTRVTPADAYNRIQMQFRNRVNQYTTEVVGVEDQNAIELYGLQTASQVTCDFICTSAIAKQSLQLKLQRMLYIRNIYEFELGARYAALEPMDIVTLTDTALGLSRTPVRIIKIEERDHSFKITAEDFPIGAANAATYTHDNGLHWTNASNLTPSNCAAPVIFELPADPSSTGLSVAIATGGQTTDLVYGGCRVWLSLDGVNYKAEGTISGSARYGTTTASLASHAAGNDTTSTLAVGLRSGGQLISGSAADASKGTTLIYVGGEYLAYQTATLTGANAYNLTTLNRGLYSTPTSGSASGASWARVDSSIFALRDLDLSMIGQTVYIKLTAFNTYEGGEQSLASVTAYTYTITGAMKALETTLFKGLYSSSTAYSIGMVVDLADGSTYQYISLTPGAGIAVTNTAYWEQLAPPSSLGSLTGSVDFAAQVSGATKPANNATKNVTTYSSTAPTSPTDGDIWVDTSVSPSVTRLRSGGAWNVAANYVTNTTQLTDGAGLGTTATWGGVGSKPANIGALTGSEAINNALLAPTLTALGTQGQNALYNAAFTLGTKGWSMGSMVLTQDYRGNIVQPPSGTGGTFVATSTDGVICAPGQTVTLSAVFTGAATVNAHMWCDVEWHNANNGALISYSSSTANGCLFYNTSGVKVRNSQSMTVPNSTDGSTAVIGYVRIVNVNDVAYVSGTRWVQQIKFEVGSIVTPFTDDATSDALTIVNQGPWATSNLISPSDVASTVNTGGGVAANRVATPALVAGAISNYLALSSTFATGLSASLSGSITPYSSASRIFVTAAGVVTNNTGSFGSGSAVNFTAQLTVNGTVIATAALTNIPIGGTFSFTVQGFVTSPSGAQTISLNCSPGTTAINLTNQTILALELKR